MVGGVGGAGEVDGAAVFGDDAAADPEAEAGAAFSFGGVEGLEEVGEDVFGDAGPVVVDGDEDAGFAADSVVVEAGGQGLGGDDDFAVGVGGLRGVGEEIGEDLAEFGGEAVDAEFRWDVLRHGDAGGGEARFHEEEDGVEKFFELDFHGGFGFAVEGEHGAGDLGDTGDLLLGEREEVFALLLVGDAVHEEEEVGDGIERVVDFVGDGGGEAAGDGEFFVGEEGFLRFFGEGNVAEDEDDADERAVFVADGRAGVFDVDFRAVAAGEDGVVLQACELVGAGDADDGVFEGFAGGFVDDGEDEFDGLIAGVAFGPAGELLGGVVEGLDAAFDVAGDDSVTDGAEGGAEALFRAEGLLGADAEDVVRLAEGGGDLLDEGADVKADDEADGDGGDEERNDGGADLAAPALDGLVSDVFGERVERGDAGADVVHAALAVEVEGDVVSFAAGLDGGDEGSGKGLLPGFV